MDDEILELNDDGEFVVPTPAPTQNVPITNTTNSAKSVTKSIEKMSIANASDTLNSIANGDYKIFTYDNKLDVVIRLENSKESVRSVNVSNDKIITIESSNGARLSIDLGDVTTSGILLDANNANACNYEEYVIISFAKK
jgi:hypothetical protein